MLNNLYRKLHILFASSVMLIITLVISFVVANTVHTEKVVNGVTTQFYTNGTSILAQKSSDGTRLDFLYDDQGKLFAMEYEGERYF